MSNRSSYYSPEHAMLIDEGTTLSPSRNTSPDIVLTIPNPDVGCVSRSGHPEVLGRIPIPITASVPLTNPHGEVELGTSSRIEGAHDSHHAEHPAEEEAVPPAIIAQAPSTVHRVSRLGT